jgi:hypothetical protein
MIMMMMMMSVYVCMSEYSIYAFIYNEDNYAIGNKKKILMTIWNCTEYQVQLEIQVEII